MALTWGGRWKEIKVVTNMARAKGKKGTQHCVLESHYAVLHLKR